VAQARLADRATRAARARGVAPAESAVLEPVTLARRDGNGAAAGAPPPRGEGNAEEWLTARAETRGGNGGGSRASRASSAARIRMRVRYTKRGPARFIGSRELAEVFYRVVRRASLPVASSAGYHPLPRLSFGPGLPLGLASDAEFLDLDLTDHVAPDVLVRSLDGQLPDGMRIEAAAPLLPGAPGIGAAITAFRYRVEIPSSVCAGETLAARVAAFEAAASFPVVKRGKGGAERTVDVRPTTTLTLFPPDGLEVTARVTTGATPAVHAVVATALGLDDERARRLAITKVDTLFAEGAGSHVGSGLATG
jgi:radical SAM-linked protein